MFEMRLSSSVRKSIENTVENILYNHGSRSEFNIGAATQALTDLIEQKLLEARDY